MRTMKAAGLVLAALFSGAALAAPPQGTYTVRVAVDAASVGARLPAELFGINSTWGDAGGGILEYGEMVRDRSFRNPARLRPWIESPNKDAGGKVRFEARGGDEQPWAGRGYPGHAVLSQAKPGYTCVSQQTTEGTIAGERYELHVSARADGQPAAIAAFFSDKSFVPIEKADRFVAITPGVWADYRAVLEPSRTDAFGMLRVCLVSAGTVAIDEVRLQRMGGAPRVKDAALARVMALGIRSMRWPAGSDADFFAWRESAGPMRRRGENPSAFGAFQTPAWGLHEFLDFCEAQGLVPLITVNLRDGPASAADLFEYVNGPATSRLGALRSANGRERPWNVRHFELGNEPAEYYKSSAFSGGDTAKGYVSLAKPVARAMRAAALGRPLELKGALETTFAVAEWLGIVPMLSKWNGHVLDRESGLVRDVDQVHGHFYSAFTYRDNDREQWEEVMAGGATLAAIVSGLRQKYAPLPPFWLTEYSVLVEKKGIIFITANEILLERAKDFQAGMAAADLLMTAIREGYAGAHLFNLSEFGTWGVLANYSDFRLRPAGHAFALLSRMALERKLPATVTGSRSVRIKGTDGNNPKDARFETVSAVASRGDGAIQVVLLNRSYDAAERVWIDLAGVSPRRARLDRLGPAEPNASNDERADTVLPTAAEVPVDASGHVVELPPRSLLRVTYPAS
jgi:alpha-L-arabinofuranosidase